MKVASALATTVVMSLSFIATPALAQEPPPAPPPAANVTAPAAPTTTLHGTVTAGDDHAPQPGASVSIAALGIVVFTDENGAYTMTVPPGPHVIRIEAAGYLAVDRTVTVADTPAALDVQVDETGSGEVITIIGSRTPRSRLETPVPVDVIGNDVISEAGPTEMNQILNAVAPSFNASHLAVTDGTDHIDPADLRGLGPEHVLVLINGKRLHQSSLINVYNGGTVGVDLNAIPTSAIARIEVLRDGAASQYGSDAIAGVINIVLKDTVDLVDLYSMTGITATGDGAQLKLGANTGMKLGDRGFVNLTGEFFSRGRTNRSEPWSGDIFNGITGTDATDAELRRRGLTRNDFTMDVGTSGALVGTGVLNAGYKLGSGVELYAQGGYTYRKGNASGFYRLPDADFEDRSDLRIYPNGFLPQINPVLMSWNATAGARARSGPWQGDLSLTYGGDSFHFFVDHSLNASLGVASPTSFDAGRLGLNQTSLNFDGVRRIDPAALHALSLVAGAELRREDYHISAGQPESYELGPELDAEGNPKSPGSQVFPGFRPSDASNNSRLSEAVYAGVESEPSALTNLDVGARFEHYSDFGNTLTGKIAGRIAAIRTADSELAVRGSASTGFRAPGLQQIYYSTIATQFINDPMTGTIVPSNILISPNRSPVTENAFGVPNLKEETSVNLSGGVTARLKSLSISADYYHVTLKDRVVLTSLFQTGDAVVGGAVTDILAQFPGVGAAQFFVNAVDTSTDGVDLVVDYNVHLPRGNLKATAAANFTRTVVDDVHVPQSMLEKFSSIEGGAERVQQLFLGRYGKNLLEDRLPHQKATLGLRYDHAIWTAGVRANYFGPSKYHDDGGPQLDETWGRTVIFDTDIGYRVHGMSLIVGASNLFNTFPDQMKHPDNRYNDSFLYSPVSVPAGTPFGTDGAFYYVKLEYQR
ncbi:MAG TPA: TonB-dependent receptor [Kofleriaceae bacterium]|nr:TonB-dependent receptor [Kofleriaceae bacterium]